MKKTFIMLMCLFGLSAFKTAISQNLVINNNSDCDFLVVGEAGDAITCSIRSTIGTAVSGRTTGVVVTFPGAPLIPFRFTIIDCDGIAAYLKSPLPCSSSNLIATIPPSSCCSVGVTVTLTPGSTTTNAIIDIN